MALYLTCLSPRGWPETAFSGTDLVASSRQSQKKKKDLNGDFSETFGTFPRGDPH